MQNILKLKIKQIKKNNKCKKPTYMKEVLTFVAHFTFNVIFANISLTSMLEINLLLRIYIKFTLVSLSQRIISYFSLNTAICIMRQFSCILTVCLKIILNLGFNKTRSSSYRCIEMPFNTISITLILLSLKDVRLCKKQINKISYIRKLFVIVKFFSALAWNLSLSLTLFCFIALMFLLFNIEVLYLFLLIQSLYFLYIINLAIFFLAMLILLVAFKQIEKRKTPIIFYVQKFIKTIFNLIKKI